MQNGQGMGDSMAEKFRVEFRDSKGNWHPGEAFFPDENIAVEAAKLLSEQNKTLARIVDLFTGKVHSLVEVI
jgi:hypothetical protein